ncbi:MAG TPA: lipoyl(octanoyl) transferase LipB [Gammaproteobacteria bacterium]|jgi:lipoyl(octanoyl) transferase|nr:lipoyl(octanoyl) transferase LipB [Gammaproteobacteria bacterium]
MTTDTVIIRTLNLQDYLPTLAAMQQFTQTRHEKTFDEIWLLEHPSVFTQGQNGKAEHILNPGNIPVIQVDRGGQVTYHGPGQLVAYTLVDIQRKKFNVRQMVNLLEKSVIDCLTHWNIKAQSRCDAPGVYVDQDKICSIGLRIRRGSSFHGLALNVTMDLEPFTRIHPCGFQKLKMTQMTSFDKTIDIPPVQAKLVEYLVHNLGYNHFLHLAEKWYGTKNIE